MSESIEFYFDFSSSYSYVAHRKIEDLAGELGLSLHWKPISLGAIFTALEHRLPKMGSAKQKYIWHDVERSAAEQGLPYVWPDPFPMNSIPAMRGFYFLQDQDPALAKTYARAVFAAAFGEGRDIARPDILIGIVERLGFDPESFKAGISSEDIKTRLKAETAAAQEKGIFGAPTFLCRGEMFWGADRLASLEAFIRKTGDKR
tara:strand:- start:10887 stop:11495 length:609 start_codon:yes stop_codon:yes gene_type:complete